MGLLILGLTAFFGLHLLPAFPEARGALAARLGEYGYRGLFSAGSLATLVLLIWGYAQAPFVGVWEPPAGLRYVTAVLMLPAFVALAAAYSPGRIKQRLKHPMLVSVKIWALAHLLTNGDLASILLFGGFLGYAVLDRILVGKREERVPVKTVKTNSRNDFIAIAAGVGLYLIFVFWLHEWLTGVPVFGQAPA